MIRAQKGKFTCYSEPKEFRVWRYRDGSFRMTFRGVKANVAIYEDGKRRNGHPTLFRQLDRLMKAAAR
jgi:hypothetical protein